MRAIAVVLAVLGAVWVAVGAVMVYLPAGLIVTGAELIAASYVVGYLGARR